MNVQLLVSLLLSKNFFERFILFYHDFSIYFSSYYLKYIYK